VILVITEQKDGKLNRASWEAIAAAQELSGGSVPVKWRSSARRGGVASELATAAVAEVLTVTSRRSRLPPMPSCAAAALITGRAPAHAVPHTRRATSPPCWRRLDRA
jgi:hypothetical protein